MINIVRTYFSTKSRTHDFFAGRTAGMGIAEIVKVLFARHAVAGF